MRYKFIILLLVVLTSMLLAQRESDPVNITTRTNYKKQEYKNGSAPSYFSGNYNTYQVFDDGNSNGSRVYVRSSMDVYLPTYIPNDVEITKIMFEYRTTYGYIFNLYYLSSDPNSQNYDNAWNALDDGTHVGRYVGERYRDITVDVTATLKSYIVEALNSNPRKMYFGVTANEGSSINGFGKFTRCKLIIYYNESSQVTVKNNVEIGNLKVNSVIRNSGYVLNTFERKTNTFGAIEPQILPTGKYLWNDTEGENNLSDWQKTKGAVTSPLGTTQNIPYTVLEGENAITITANMRRYYDVSFGPTSNGVTVTGHSSSLSYKVVEGNQITATAPISYISTGLKYTFTQWSNGNTSRILTFSPTQDINIEPQYSVKPISDWKTLTLLSRTGQNIKFSWNEHPSSSVTKYAIYRKVKLGATTYLGEVNRGVGVFIDPDYEVTNNTSGDLLSYDVRAYYQPTGVWADPDFSAISLWGWLAPKININNESIAVETIDENIISNYSLSNYPNPFNPTTKISYQLPKAGNVSLKVYNSIGKEVATLVSEYKPEGRYTATFNAGNLASGIYYYTIQVNDFTKTKKMLLVK